MVALALAWPGALCIGLSLGLLGSGGSILTVPVLVYLFGQDEKVAIAGSLAIVGLIAAAGALPYIRQGLVDWRSVAWFGVPGMVGTWGGAWASALVSGSVQLAVFALVMLLAAAMMLRQRPLPAPAAAGGSSVAPAAGPPAATSRTRSTPKVVADGFAVGAVTGFVGVGGGFLVVPALVLLGGLAMHAAVATSLVIIALKSAAGFVKYLDVLGTAGLRLDWAVVGLVAAIGVFGSLAGSRLATRIPQARLRTGFGWFLVVMGAWILYSTGPAALGLDP